MIFIEYEELKEKFNKAQKEYDKLLDQKEIIILSPQVKSTQIKVCTSTSNKKTDKTLEYLISLEELMPKLNESRSLLGEREYLLKLKKLQLVESQELLDKVYVMRYIENMPVKHIARNLIYSKQRIYQLLEEIKNIRKY